MTCRESWWCTITQKKSSFYELYDQQQMSGTFFRSYSPHASVSWSISVTVVSSASEILAKSVEDPTWPYGFHPCLALWRWRSLVLSPILAESLQAYILCQLRRLVIGRLLLQRRGTISAFLQFTFLTYCWSHWQPLSWRHEIKASSSLKLW